MSSARPVGALACQLSSYLKNLRTRIVSCNPTPQTKTSSSSSTQEATYDVVLEDSVFFPEGGGQPCDLGTINGLPITGAVRVGDTCVVRTTTAFDVGAEVETEIDWARRLDHMQHHSAQHLLTAVVEKELNLPTESWALTHPSCYIQVPTSMIKEDDVRRVEAICNSFITSGTKVDLRVFPSREDVPASRSRGIPSDVTGPIRIIDIPDVDSCTCCGTHVETLGALRMLKLLHQEPKGNTCRLHFVAGDRVDHMFSDMYLRERQLIKELGTNAENIVPSVVRRGKESTEGTKQCRKLFLELAAHVAQQVLVQATALPAGVVFTYRREDADMDYLTVIGDVLSKQAAGRVALLGAGTDATGQFLIVGPTAEVGRIAPAVCTALEGKGGQSKQGFRGKGNMKKWSAAVKAVQISPPVEPSS